MFAKYFKDMMREVFNKRKLIYLFGLMFVIFVPKLIQIVSWNQAARHEISKNPILYTVNSIECLKNDSLMQNIAQEEYIQNDLDDIGVEIDTVHFIHSLNLNYTFNDTSYLSNLHGVYPKNLTKMFGFLIDHEIIDLDGVIPENDNEIIIDQHLRGFLSNTVNKTIIPGTQLNLTISNLYNSSHTIDYFNITNQMVKIVGIYTIREFDCFSNVVSLIKKNFWVIRSSSGEYESYTMKDSFSIEEYSMFGLYDFGIELKEKLCPIVSFWNRSSFSDIFLEYPFIYHVTAINPLYLDPNLKSNDIRIFRNLFRPHKVQNDIINHNIKYHSEYYILIQSGLETGDRLFRELNEQLIMYQILIIIFTIFVFILLNLVQKTLLRDIVHRIEVLYGQGVRRKKLFSYYLFSEFLLIIPAFLTALMLLNGIWMMLNVSSGNLTLFTAWELYINSSLIVIGTLITHNSFYKNRIKPQYEYNNKDQELREERLNYRTPFPSYNHNKKSNIISYIIFGIMTVLIIFPLFVPKSLLLNSELEQQTFWLNSTIFFLIYPILVIVYLIYLGNYFLKVTRFIIKKVHVKIYGNFIFNNTKLVKFYLRISRKHIKEIKGLILITFFSLSMGLALNNSLNLQEDYIIQRNIQNFGSDLKIVELPYIAQEYDNVSSNYSPLSEQIQQNQDPFIEKITRIVLIASAVTSISEAEFKESNTVVINPIEYFNMFDNDEYNIDFDEKRYVFSEIIELMNLGEGCIVSRSFAAQNELEIGNIIQVSYSPSIGNMGNFYFNKSGEDEFQIIGIADFAPGLEISKGSDLILGEVNFPSPIIARTSLYLIQPQIINLVRLDEDIENRGQIDDIISSLYNNYDSRIANIEINPQYDTKYIQYEYFELMTFLLCFTGLFI
ncbi:MAG: hypothetical protein GF364_00835, partial [Candidatus Lokiarchaeota archaeon]|nr:hypothetical protein [Candidatus Lokiarchaeota archaeon]